MNEERKKKSQKRLVRMNEERRRKKSREGERINEEKERKRRKRERERAQSHDFFALTWTVIQIYWNCIDGVSLQNI